MAEYATSFDKKQNATVAGQGGLEGAISGAATGAGIGMMASPLGALAGGLIGAAVGAAGGAGLAAWGDSEQQKAQMEAEKLRKKADEAAAIDQSAMMRAQTGRPSDSLYATPSGASAFMPGGY